MTECLEQQYCIKFCLKTWGYPSGNNLQIPQAFSDDAVVVTQIKEWFNRFKDG
jgi:hypothetical protein